MKKVIPHTHFIAAIILSSVLASIGLIGGLGIQLVRQDILAFLPLLIALPAMNAIAGDYATLTAAHLADPESNKKHIQKLIVALFTTLPVSCIGVSALSLGIAQFKGFEITGELAVEYIKLVFITLYVVVFLIFCFIYLTKKALLTLDVNIDDTLIPVANTIASVVMLTGFAIMTTHFA